MNRPAETFRERLLEHAMRIGDVPALIAPTRSLTYGELAGEVHALALALRSRRIGRGSLVALTARREIPHLLATLALFELGVPQVTLPSHDPRALRERLARRIGVTAILGDQPDDAVADLAWIDLGAALAESRESPRDAVVSPTDPEIPALYLSGSGTTGEPKIIAFTERFLALQADRQNDFRGQRILRPAHVSYNNAKRMRLYALWQGGTCVLADGTTESLHAQVSKHRVTWLEISPVHGTNLVVACRTEGPLPPATAIRVGGARSPIALRRAIIAHASPLLHVSYGTTETSLVSMAGPALHDARELVGPPMRGVEAEVVRGDGSAAAPGEIGEIRIRAAGMASGYAGDEVATARCFRDGWFMPGDLASLDRDGRLSLHGRIDDLMIMNGINIFPAEIERVLEAHPAVQTAAAFPIASRVHGQIPIAAVELRAGIECTAAELLGHARDELGLRAPRRVEILAALPRNAQGKVVKRLIDPGHAAGTGEG